MSRSTRLAAVAGLALVLTIGAAAPAFAFGPADITVTPQATGEDPLTTLAVVCPATSTSVSVTWTGADGGAPVTYGPSSETLDGVGEWSNNYYLESFFDRDTDATFTIDCLDAALASTGTDSVVYHLPTTGAVSSTPATLAANADLVATGNCGTATGVFQLSVEVYDMSGPTSAYGPTTIAYTGPANYSVNVGTPASLGLAAGDTARFYVNCGSNTGSVHTSSIRFTETAILAAAVTPAATAGPALAATGSESVLPLAAGGGLLLLGAAVLILRRRREAAANGR